MIKLYTAQSLEAWNKAQVVGYLTGGDGSHLIDECDTEVYKPAYSWMKTQMHKRLPNYSGDFPIWAWFNAPDSDYHMEENDMIIEFEVPEDRILISNFGAWHSVLNNQPMYFEDREYSKEEIEKSWDLIFDLNDLLTLEYGSELQVCVDKVYLNEIKI